MGGAVLARRGDRLVQPVGSDVAGEDTRAALREGHGDGAAETVRRAGDECGAAAELDVHAGCRNMSGSRSSSSRLAVESGRLPSSISWISAMVRLAMGVAMP